MAVGVAWKFPYLARSSDCMAAMQNLMSRWEHLVYQFGCHDNTIKYVIKEGRVLVER